MTERVLLPSGVAVGIGKLKIFASEEFPHEIPTFSFIVTKNDTGTFTATCLQLIIDGCGDTPNSATVNMREHVIDFLDTLFSMKNHRVSAWDQLHNLYSESIMAYYWKAYHDIQLNLAENGVCTDMRKIYMDEITELKKRIADLEAIVNTTAKEKFTARIVDYQEPAA